MNTNTINAGGDDGNYIDYLYINFDVKAGDFLL